MSVNLNDISALIAGEDIEDVIEGESVNVDENQDTNGEVEVGRTPAEEGRADKGADDDSERDEDAGDEDKTTEEQSAGDDEPMSLDELAAELGVSAKLLYDVKIPMGSDEPMTLGEFKDRARELRELDVTRDEFERTRTSFERDQTIARKEITDIFAVIPQQWYTPQVVQAAQEVARQTQLREADALDAALPEWRDPNVRQAEWREITQEMRNYGYRDYELDGVEDHRVKLVLREFVKYKKAYESAEPGAKRVRDSQKNKPSRKVTGDTSLRAAINRAKRPGATDSDKTAGVAALINKG